MRDSLIERIYEIAKEDPNVVFVSADMGSPAFEKFRKELGRQTVNVGIAEENMIAVAVGLGLSGKKVFTYAIAPFITSRCYEFTKVDVSLMKVPITLLGVGAGFSYDDSGPTHHTTEDISIMRALPNLEIYGPSDNLTARACADMAYASKNPVYVRMDRKTLPDIYEEGEDFSGGFKELREGKNVCIITTGNMVHKALEAHDRLAGLGKDVGVIDLLKIKPLNPNLKDTLGKYNQLVSLEEHLLDGGLGSMMSEMITDNDMPLKLKRIGLKSYHYVYGGRDNMHKVGGIDVDTVVNTVRNY